MLQQLPRLSPVSSWIAGARSESLWPMERHVAWCFTGWLGLPMDSAMRYGKPKQISESKSLIYVQTCEKCIFFMQPTTLNNTMFFLLHHGSILNLDLFIAIFHIFQSIQRGTTAPRHAGGPLFAVVNPKKSCSKYTPKVYILYIYMGVSKNRGTWKWMVYY